MILIPAIDLMNNQCVRLSQGNFSKQTVYSTDPVETALKFQHSGFTHLHVVDLDGAKKKSPVHLAMLKKISESCDLFVDFSGGIRSLEQASEAFKNGASAITVGSMAVNDPETTLSILEAFGSEKVILGADVKNEYIATAGWLEKSDRHIIPFLENWLDMGFRKVMVTDVAKDGMMQGPSFSLYQVILDHFSNINLIASGGIANIDDIIGLHKIGCYGAITGKALYEATISEEDLNRYWKEFS